jgi:CHRD domain
MGMIMHAGGSRRRFGRLSLAVGTAVLLLVLSGCADAHNAVSRVPAQRGNTLSNSSTSTPSTSSTSTPGSTTVGTTLVATLAPEAPNTSGNGTARLLLRPQQQTICAVLHVTGIALPATKAHIHRGAAGTSGPIVVMLTAPNTQGISTGCTHVEPALINSITQHPADYYVNVHNATYPDGAVRGQLSTCGPHMNC